MQIQGRIALVTGAAAGVVRRGLRRSTALEPPREERPERR